MTADHAPSQGWPALAQSFPKVDVHSGELRLSGQSPKFGWLPGRDMWGGKMVGPELQDDYLRFFQTLMPHVATVNFTWGN